MAKVTIVDGDTSITEDVSPNPDSTTLEQLEAFQRAKAQVAKVSFAEALQYAVTAESDVEVLNKDKKDSLIGVPFIITSVRVNATGNFGPYVTITAVTEDEKNIVINDGSSGIASQMFNLVQEHGVNKPILIKNGLRKSVYYVDKETGKVVGKEPKPNSFAQSTYYFDI